MQSFLINGAELVLGAFINTQEALKILSVPRPYQVEFQSGEGAGERIRDDMLGHASPLLLVDQWVFNNYLKNQVDIKRVPSFIVPAVEQSKSIDTVLEIVSFLEKNCATKNTMLYAVGGGVVQDLAAFSAYIYKRGIPWTFVPTTLLAQGDSCVGGKTALNHKQTKNLLALFSAPRRIITDTGFLTTLTHEDWLSGGGEILRLCITGGEASLLELERGMNAFLARDLVVTTHLIRTSLAVKKAVVEFDEFELDARRSMNYGHSFGHALEALTEFKIHHGTGVVFGILVENEISFKRGVLALQQRDRIISLANQIISNDVFDIFRNASMDGVTELLKRDKKAEGPVLKLASLTRIGQIDFVDLPLNAQGETEVRQAYSSVVQSLSELRHA